MARFRRRRARTRTVTRFLRPFRRRRARRAAPARARRTRSMTWNVGGTLVGLATVAAAFPKTLRDFTFHVGNRDFKNAAGSLLTSGYEDLDSIIKDPVGRGLNIAGTAAVGGLALKGVRMLRVPSSRVFGIRIKPA